MGFLSCLDKTKSPATDAATEAVNMAILEFCICVLFTKARLVMKIDMVNPMPPNIPPFPLCDAS